MDVKLLAGLSAAVGLIAACVSIACLVRIEDLHKAMYTGRPRGGRRTGHLHGRGKVLPFHEQPPRR